MANFTHGLCDCFGDCGTCCLTYFCRCIPSGNNAESVGENCLLYGVCSLLPCFMVSNGMIRQKIRERYNIDGSLLNDIVCHWCCSCCAIIQDAREISAHGAAPVAASMARE